MNRQDKGHQRVRNWKSGPNFSGQHLLHNKEVIKELIKKAHINSNDTVIDLGAGKGALTLVLAEKAKRVIAVENDPAFVAKLRKKAKDYLNITIIEKDILKWKLPDKPFHVVSNIPYSITTPILMKLLSKPTNALQGAVILMEKGAAKRFTANPITDPRILGWRMWFDMKIVKEVSRDNFFPTPKVDSAAVRIKRKVSPEIMSEHYKQFTGLAEYGLKYPELPIYESLKDIFTLPQMKRLIKNIGVKGDTPVCLLNEEQWGEVFSTMVQYAEPFRWPKVNKKVKNEWRNIHGTKI